MSITFRIECFGTIYLYDSQVSSEKMWKDNELPTEGVRLG